MPPCIVSRHTRIIAGCHGALLHLSSDLRDVLELLHRSLMPLKRLLNHLDGFLAMLAKLLKLGGMLLLLLKELLIILRTLLGLVHKLLDDLVALVDLTGNR